MDWQVYAWKLLPLVLVSMGVLNVIAFLVYFERKISAFIQDRVGPNRVGLFGPDSIVEALVGRRFTSRRILGGLIQPFADTLKLLTKEDILPRHADRVLYTLAPFFALLPPFLTFAVLPVGADLVFRGQHIPLIVADLGVGVLWVLSVASLSAYGVALGGWASNSKFSLLGGVRATAQMISYEIALGLALLCMIMHFGSVSLRDMAIVQSAGVSHWGLFHQPLAALIFLCCAFAENNRLPFDMPECESELVGGYHTEYSSMKFGMFFMGEYVAMMAMGALLTAVFLGAWHYPGYAWVGEHWGQNAAALLSLASFALKTLGYVLFSIWVRWTLPRFRYDQLMRLGWKVLIPLGLVNLMLTALMNVR